MPQFLNIADLQRQSMTQGMVHNPYIDKAKAQLKKALKDCTEFIFSVKDKKNIDKKILKERILKILKYFKNKSQNEFAVMTEDVKNLLKEAK